MTSFTAAYLLTLSAWGLGAAAIEGAFLWFSWWAWDRATAGSNPALRQRIACSHLVAVLVLPFVTMLVFHFALTRMGTEIELGPVPHPFGPELAKPMRATWPGLLAGLWICGAALAALRLAVEGRRVVSLAGYRAPADLVRRVHRLAKEIGLSTAVRVREAEVRVPQVTGLRRPVLLLPADISASLTGAELEAVLLHELAHVRRCDFGWNLAQNLLLTLVWFHPAAWALHRATAREREACCDALAVRNGASPRILARALLRLAECRSEPRLGMAASGDGDLHARVQRLVGPVQGGATHKPFPGLPFAASALCIASLCAGLLAPRDVALRDLYVASGFGPDVHVGASDPFGRFELRIRQGRVVEAAIGGRSLPNSMIVQHGGRVTLFDPSPGRSVNLEVTALGRIRWNARRVHIKRR